MRLLVIDDESLILETIRYAFPGDHVRTFTTATQGIESFRSDLPDVVLCDIRLPDMSGMDAFQKLHTIDPRVPIILMTGQGTAGTAIEAMQRGAFEYVLKPLDPDKLIQLVQSAAETGRMSRIKAVLPSEQTEDEEDLNADLLIGNCEAMQEVYRSIGRVARQDVTVLILGESGTGKEVVARAIYQYSNRNKGRFLAINCAAIPEPLLESELFGHEKGAFTGADTKRIGKFELCNEGTLFMDEIGDMTPLMQTKILRVLQDQSFERVGGNVTVQTTAHVVAATNRNLEQAIAEKQFRSDLYYRLNVYTIVLPALRDRGDDIELLANYYMRRYAKELTKNIRCLAPATIDRLKRYQWPGNVRELQSVIKHAILEATGSMIMPAFLPDFLRYDTTPQTSVSVKVSDDFDSINITQLTRQQFQTTSNDIYHDLIGIVEKKIFAEAIRQCDGNLTKAATRLGITRTTLRTRLESLGMTLQRYGNVPSENNKNTEVH